MCDLLIFGGTTEGRLLAEFCCANEIGAYVSVATEYGAELLPRSEQVHVLVGRADSDGIADMIKKHNISVVIDATHPYAEEVSRNIQRACSAENTTMYRIKRNDDEECANAVYFNSIGVAVNRSVFSGKEYCPYKYERRKIRCYKGQRKGRGIRRKSQCGKCLQCKAANYKKT